MPTPLEIKKLEGILDPLVKQRYLKYFQLPQDLRRIIFTTETAGKIEAAAKKSQLDKNQLWQTSYTTGMILLGEINIVDFVKTLQEECQLDEASARRLARDINQAVFLPVKQSLKEIHQIPEWPREDESAEPITPESVIPTVPKPNEPRIEGNIVDLKQE